jgi:hypothetical protein
VAVVQDGAPHFVRAESAGQPVGAILIVFPNVAAIYRGFRVIRTLDKEVVMPLARVVSFDGVSSDRMAEMQREMQGREQPENVPAKEIVVLHDPEGEKSLVILFFETDDDYQRADEALNAMPAGDTPGQRTSVTKYEVAVRMTD